MASEGRPQLPDGSGGSLHRAHLLSGLPATERPSSTGICTRTFHRRRDILYPNAVRFRRLEEDASGALPSKEELPWEP